MILAGDVQGFGLFGADILLGAFDAGMAEQQLGGAQVTGLLIDMGRKSAAQRVQPIEPGIEAGFFQPGFEQPPELAFAEVAVRLSRPLPGEQPAMQRLFRGGEIGSQAVAGARGQPRLDGPRIAGRGFFLADFDDLADAGRGRHIRDLQAHQVGAAEAGIERHVE